MRVHVCVCACVCARVRVRAGAHLSEGYDEIAEVFLPAGEADVVVGDEELTGDVHLGEGGPQSAVRVSVQPLLLGQTEQGAVPLVLGPGVQVPGRGEGEVYAVRL